MSALRDRVRLALAVCVMIAFGSITAMATGADISGDTAMPDTSAPISDQWAPYVALHETWRTPNFSASATVAQMYSCMR